MLYWIIEYLNGCCFQEGKHRFDFSNSSLIKKVYFYDGKSQFGFNYQTGIFFINNILYDFKVNLDNFRLIPIQYKTGILTLEHLKSQPSVYSWNIGYKLENNNESYEYIMSIMKNQEVIFKAKHFDFNKDLIDQKMVKLQ